MSARELITEHLDLWTGAVTKKSSSGRGNNGKVELTGIKKLRELILELAVQGKLVDQSQEDEPSSELLKKIVAEKTKRIESGEIKKPKKLPAIDEAELPFQIPSSWKFIRLGDAVDIIRGITFPASEKSKSPAAGRLACLRTTNVQDTIEVHDLLYIKESFVTRNSQYVQKNDIVMSMANSRELVGKVAFVEKQPNEPMTFGGFLGVLRPTLIHPKFLMAVLRAPHSRKALIGNASQTTNIANISIGKLNPLVIGVPPLEEQHRIVQKVDELMALCDRLEQQTSNQLEAHETLVETLLGTLTQSENATELADNWARLAAHFDTLFTTEQSIDKLKQTILQLAVMGRLVEQHKRDEPAECILTQLAEVKEKLIAQGLLKKERRTQLVDTGQAPYEIPDSWRWCSLTEIGELARGKSKHRPRNDPSLYEEGTVPLIQTGDVARASPWITTFVAKYNQKGVEQSRVWRPGTLCITIAANIGDTGLLAFDSCFPDSVVGFTPFRSDIRPEYFEYFLRTAKQHLEDFAPSTAQKNINLDVLQKLLVPLPPLAEMNRIVERTDELLALCDQLKECLNQASNTRCQLAETIVQSALG